jgi:hypothetical protein
MIFMILKFKYQQFIMKLFSMNRYVYTVIWVSLLLIVLKMLFYLIIGIHSLSHKCNSSFNFDFIAYE